VDRLVDDLAAEWFDPAVMCNPYAGDGPAPAGRRRRLRRYLYNRWAAPVVLVGEAPGWRGACRSGVPLTSERQVLGVGMAETTATIVHQVLQELDAERLVLLWNTVPLHPHQPGLHDTNRAPSLAEVRAADTLLRQVTTGRQVVAAGRVAAAALGNKVEQVRHPSHGGAAEFRAGLARILEREPRPLT
jgi:Uracil DNA glycosylase superfamily